MSNTKFNQTQMTAACAIIHAYAIRHGSTGTDIHQRSAALAVLAVLVGKLSAVPEPYREFAVNVDPHPESQPDLMPLEPSDDPASLPEQSLSLLDILKGVGIELNEVPETEMVVLSVNETAAGLLEIQPGDYMHSSDVDAAVEAAREVGELVDGMEPDDGDNTDEDKGDFGDLGEEIEEDAKVNFDDMTVAQIEAFAKTNEVDLSGLSRKADFIARLREFGY